MSALILLLVFSFLVGCRKEEPNPELLDPIFVDLDKRAKEFEKSHEDEKERVKELYVTIGKSDANTLELRNARRDLSKSLKLALSFEQKARFYKIRANRRMLIDRITYKAAFAKKEPWPKPGEYSDYQVNIRLEEASRNWGARVPKLQNRLAGTRNKPAKADKPAH